MAETQAILGNYHYWQEKHFRGGGWRPKTGELEIADTEAVVCLHEVEEEERVAVAHRASQPGRPINAGVARMQSTRGTYT